VTATRSAAGADTLCSLFQRSAAEHPTGVALMGGGAEVTWADYARRVGTLSTRWGSVGVETHGPVALMLHNSPVFHVVDTSLMHAGALPFSVSDTDPVDRLVALLDVARARVLVTDQRSVAHALAVAEGCRQRPTVVVVDGVVAGAVSLHDVESAAAGPVAADDLWRAIDPEDDATLIFTSGTTGEPKAVRLSHRAIVMSLRNTDGIAPVGPRGHVLSYLPLSHIAERFMSHYTSLGHGATITCIADAATLYDEIVRIRPSRFFGVPRVYEKLVDRVRQELAIDPRLADAAEVGLGLVRAEQSGATITPDERAAWDEALTILAPVRAMTGLDRTEYRGVATAPSSPFVLELMSAIGLPVGNIWGMSEAIMCTMNPPERLKLDTVGVFLDGVEGMVATDGELLVRGVNLFSGYLHDEQRTAEAIGADGWLRTGDLGRIDADGYLSIVGRKKEILITATGKNIAPAAIEAALKHASPLIDHAVAIADGRRFVTALLALDEPRVRALAQEHGVTGDFATVCKTTEVQARLAAAVQRANTTLQKAETVRAWAVADRPWEPGGDEVTPTMKLRRSAINEMYAEQIETLYAPQELQ
jgi:long-subunit acyl-CoA synthetase (AMP-forming)